MTLNLGDIAEQLVELRTPADGRIDPGTISARVTAPSGTVTTYAGVSANIVRVAAGLYSVRHPCAEHGRHRLRVLLTGPGGPGLVATAEEEFEFFVRP